MGLAMQPRERFHYRGKYVIRTEWRGKTLLYDVLTKSGQPVTAGLDMLSGDEETAVEGITDRLYGKAQAA